MRKFTSILVFFLACMVGVKAQELTTVISSETGALNSTANWNHTWTGTATPTVTLKSTLIHTGGTQNNMSIRATGLTTGYIAMNSGNQNGNSCYYTVSVPAGYRITKIAIEGKPGSGTVTWTATDASAASATFSSTTSFETKEIAFAENLVSQKLRVAGTNQLFQAKITVYYIVASATVTYKVVDANGNALKTVISQEVPGTTIGQNNLPSGFLSSYATHTFPSDLTVQDGANNAYEVTYTGTTGLPFTVVDSYDAISTWKYLRIAQAGYYIGADASAGYLPLTVTTLPAGDESYQWAFVGNPYTGITLYNKSTGNTKVLASDSPANAANTGGNTYVTLQTAGTKAVEAFYPVVSTANASVSGFLLGATDGGNYMNNRSNKLAYWTGGSDIGSTFYVEDVPEDYAARTVSDYSAKMTALAAKVSATKPFCVPQTTYDALLTQYNEAAAAPTTADEYNTFAAAYNSAVAVANLNPLNAGYYRIVSNQYAGRTIAATSDNKLTTVTATEAATDLGSIVTVSAGQTAGKVLLGFNGMYAGTVSQSAQVALAATGVEYTPQAVGLGYGSLAAGTGQYEALHVSASQENKVVGWEVSAGASLWQLEPVESITLALNAVDGTTYATAYLPFGVTIPTGFTAYGVSTDGTVADLGSDVPAGTPFLLMGTETSATLTLNASAAAETAANALQGTYVAKTVGTGEVLTLGRNGGTGDVGFFTFTGTTVPANKAYFNATQLASGVQSILFNGGVTGIGTATTAAASAESIYDLQGRKVAKAEKGLYIVNGKKVLVK